MTLTGAGADDEAGASMSCDDDGDEGGVLWVTVHPVTVTFGVDGAADRRGYDTEAGAHMDCDNVVDEDCEPWVKVPEARQFACRASVPADVKTPKKKRHSKSHKHPGGPQGGGYNRKRSAAALRTTQRNDAHLTFQQTP